MCTKTDLSFRSLLGYTKNVLTFSYTNCIPSTNVLGGGGGGYYGIILTITGGYFLPLLYVCSVMSLIIEASPLPHATK